MNTFAGFWRDGAVVKPEEKHWSDCKCIFAIQKHDNSLDICLKRFSEWHTVYWLDTTTPTELTPQEAFELLKTITPTLERIEKQGNLYSAYADERISIINWGSATEYPPRERWRVPTDADKGKRCRVKIMTNDLKWKDGVFIFMTTMQPNRFVVSDIGGNVAVFSVCEVLE
jgi:hypothetical protein